MGQIPDERGLQRRHLLRQLLVRERFQQSFRPAARVREGNGELRP
jgi:hypothetical protein